MILQTQNINNNKLLDESKNEISMIEGKYKNVNEELNDYKNKNIELKKYNSELEKKLNELQKKYSYKNELEIMGDDFIGSEAELIEEDNK